MRRAKNGNDLLPLREKDSNLEVLFAKKETNFKQQEAEQHTEGKYLSVDVETDQLCQKSKIQDYTHESKESVESTTFLHVNRTSPSQVISCNPHAVASYEKDLLILHLSVLQSISYKVWQKRVNQVF